VSLGHAAFVAVGAYTCGYLERFSFALAFLAAGLLPALLGALIARPALRLAGMYLITATIALAFIVEEITVRWVAVTGGNGGMTFAPLRLFGSVDSGLQLYGMTLLATAFAVGVTHNILRTPLGRAMHAIRDSEIAAQSMGVDVARTKTIAFGLSAAFCGWAGALYAHALGYVTPEQFTIHLSLELVTLLIVGGIGTIRGVFFGAAFIVLLPDLLGVALRHFSPDGQEMVGLRPLVVGAVLILVLATEPDGLDGLLRRMVRRVATWSRAGKNGEHGRRESA
jgi:branched-chain amino acid transport system permease protein